VTAVVYAHPPSAGSRSPTACSTSAVSRSGCSLSAPLPPRSSPTKHTGLTRRVEELRCALPDDIHLSYAVKANPMPAVVQHFSRQVNGFDVASQAR
jgi:hypothetical protein